MYFGSTKKIIYVLHRLQRFSKTHLNEMYQHVFIPDMSVPPEEKCKVGLALKIIENTLKKKIILIKLL